MADEYHVQCELGNGDSRMVSWIPEKYAKKNKQLKLREENGQWEDGWVVINTYGKRLSTYCSLHERDYTRQREASDI